MKTAEDNLTAVFGFTSLYRAYSVISGFTQL